MENENLEEGRGKKGQARQAGRTQDDEWGAKDRLKKSFRNYADTRKKKTAHLDEEILDEGRDGSGMDLYIRGAQSRVNSGKAEDFGTALHQTINSAHSDKPVEFRKKLHSAVLNHVKARNRPSVKEDVEQLDELSKKTLGNYIKRSSDELHDRAAEQGRHGAKEKWDKYDDAERKASNKRRGIKKATDKIIAKEEVEQIDELSKATLGSYVKKASEDRAKKGRSYVAHKAAKSDIDQLPTLRKIVRRRQGVEKAVDKLTKEDFVDALTEEGLQAIEIGINEYFLTLGEEVDQETFDAMVEDTAEELVTELSKNTLRSYIVKASSPAEHFSKKGSKRDTAIPKAVSKLTKEDVINNAIDKYATEVEYVEISEEDHIIDVLSRHIHEKQIEKVLDLYDSLDEDNREELLDLIETTEGINEVINFIIEDANSSEEE